jgi:dienelactone hydrolase
VTFGYEARPLDYEVLRREVRDGIELSDVRFDDGAGGRAAALVARPEQPRGAGVVVAHGGFDPGKHLFADEAVALAHRGAVAVAADTTFPRSSDVAAHEHAIRAAILVQRRCLDVLATVFGVDRLGFFGHSAGGAQGAILAAAEPRLRAIVIAAMGAGVVVRGARELGLSPGELARIARFDPASWVGVAAGPALLFQHGRHDDAVSRAEARELYALAAEPKSWREYDCGHGVDGHPPAREDRLEFFARELGL